MWNIGDALGLSLTIEEVQIRVLQALTQMGCSLEETKSTSSHSRIPEST